MVASARAPEDLYGLPLEEFTPARDALAKELKAAGQKDEAAEVKRLRKPSVAAWALNCVARDQPDAIDGLLAAGADLRAAQDEALSGDAARLRDAGRALAHEVDRVAALAGDLLQSAGRTVSAAQQEKLVATLRTAAIDDAAGDVLTRGVLVDDLESTGFSLLGAPPVGDRPARPSAKPSGEAVDDGDGAGGTDDGSGGRSKKLPGAEHAPKKPRATKEQLEAVDAARRELRRCDTEAETAATKARRRAERAEAAARRAAEAQREAEEARAEAEDAAGEAETARRAAAEAADALAAAEAALPS